MKLIKAGIYKICINDYPPILQELEKIGNFETLLDASCGIAPMITLLKEKILTKDILVLIYQQK